MHSPEIRGWRRRHFGNPEIGLSQPQPQSNYRTVGRLQLGYSLTPHPLVTVLRCRYSWRSNFRAARRINLIIDCSASVGCEGNGERGKNFNSLIVDRYRTLQAV